jgi:regulator of sigma E protease
VVEREGARITATVQPQYNEEKKRVLIGVALGLIPSLPWMQKQAPLDQILYDATGIFRILRALVTPREARQAAGALGGPVMIIMALWGSIKISYIYGLGFLRFLNVNLAILNLLPIPVLDGGHVLFSLWEGITRRRVHPRVVTVLINVFAVLLIGAMLLLTYRDIFRLVPAFRKKDAAVEHAATNAVTATNAAAATNRVAPSGLDPVQPETDSGVAD